MASLASFPQFPLLPTELQLKILRHAFFSSSGFTAWLSFAHSALQYLSRDLPIPAFWKSPRYQLHPGVAIILGGQRRILVYQDSSIPNLLEASRLARQVALEEWRRVLGNLLLPLQVPCETELREVEMGLEELTKGGAGCYLRGHGLGQSHDVLSRGTNISRF